MLVFIAGTGIGLCLGGWLGVTARDGRKAHRPVGPAMPVWPSSLPGRSSTVTGQVRPGLRTDQARPGLKPKPTGSPAAEAALRSLFRSSLTFAPLSLSLSSAPSSQQRLPPPVYPAASSDSLSLGNKCDTQRPAAAAASCVPSGQQHSTVSSDLAPILHFFVVSIAVCSDLALILHIRLNDNHLTGRIPRDLAKIPSLKVVDVSHNDLCGTIPTTGPFEHIPLNKRAGPGKAAHGHGQAGTGMEEKPMGRPGIDFQAGQFGPGRWAISF
ncbi:somatic embryogenesis receptor kinase 1-like protein [Carex littledalei]|uniref:Somatic embryogenesis receptor kinase 1-like protein n=1 Tax=Carex littledalei TaxID=544730 RepID=A0A833R5N7_9POAL|nr:somatic embryogenesis receptor kinase 1-like protein [Carex littledalei]